ncbi:hypothetical protein FSP39_007459 [Pinctada imbricata]|uniref:Uncharacterized protein n=1 Tax=Pinctada imbricata TaxID=66713 RepID=A0AA88XHI3_PINIB|nr:hypothetical protein FSP39_007459 [Pinctada imbricata]
MPLTPAERAKKYRDSIKSDPEKHRKYLEKERTRYKKRKANGEYNTKNKSEREKRSLRKHWRNTKRKQREQKKNIQQGIDFMLNNSPVTSPERNEVEHNVAGSSQAQRGRKKVRKDRARAYRTIKKLEKDLTVKNKSVQKYKQRWLRLKLKSKQKEKKNEETSLSGSPKSSTIGLNSELMNDLREKYKKQKTEKAKNAFLKIVPKELLSKYRLLRKYSKATGISVHRLKKSSDEVERKSRSYVWRIRMRRQVESFLKRDLYTTMAPGKKDTITLKGVKKQKRYLNDTLANIHKKFIAEFPSDPISYSSFCKMRPFYVVNMKVGDRQTCLCTLHGNVKYRISKLHQLGFISETSPEKVCELLVCDFGRKQCAYNECNRCQKKQFVDTSGRDTSSQVKIPQWCRRTVEYEKNGVKTSVIKTVKEDVQSTIEILIDETTKLLKEKFCKHVFNIRHQYHSLKTLKDSINDNEAVIHADFSENYACKLNAEIQAMHFGGSRNQISLHTVVVYSKHRQVLYCTVSEDTRHGPAAIWAHLHPVLEWIRSDMPHIDTIHFVSDGPTTQYRTKSNFFLHHSLIHGKYGFHKSTWNFTEAGHGKSSADGVGGLVKRTADDLVSKGTDIIDVNTFYTHVSERIRNVNFVVIPSDNIDAIHIPETLKPVKGTMSLHQVVSYKDKVDRIGTRTLSCFCKWPNVCQCFANDVPEHVFSSTLNRTENCTETCNSNEGIISAEPPTSSPALTVSPDPALIGQWCVIKYDDHYYPGQIQDNDSDGAEVKCMHSVGKNRYFWPRIDDCIWYKWADVLCMIPEPQNVTARHKEIDKAIYQNLEIGSI